MKKVLFIATVVKTHIMQFHIPHLKMFKNMGWETAVAARNDYSDLSECVIPYCDSYFDIPFERTPFKTANIKAYKQLKKVIYSEKYDIIHCHTPVGGVLGRLAARKARKNGTKVFYTAHGFHFYKGAPIINWLIYYPVEKICAHHTDVLIAINKEDYTLAKKKMHAECVEYVPGVGIDINKFAVAQVDRTAKRKEIGIPENAFVLISVGELNKNKNHQLIIKAMAEINNCSLHYVIVGQGPLKEYLRSLAEKFGIEDRVHLLGYRSDIAELNKVADVFCFPSKREGLPVALMEAMACGLPVICGRIRGNTDLIEDKSGGYLIDISGTNMLKKAIIELKDDEQLSKRMSEINLEMIKGFDYEIVNEKMKKIYKLSSL